MISYSLDFEFLTKLFDCRSELSKYLCVTVEGLALGGTGPRQAGRSGGGGRGGLSTFCACVIIRLCHATASAPAQGKIRPRVKFPRHTGRHLKTIKNYAKKAFLSYQSKVYISGFFRTLNPYLVLLY